MTKRLRIAIQKSGRLSDDSLALLKRAGCEIHKNRSNLFFPVENLPIDLLLVRDDDISGFVSQGVADLGIVGLNEFNESKLSHANLLSIFSRSIVIFPFQTSTEPLSSH